MPLNNDPWANFPDAPAVQPAGPQPPAMTGAAPPLPPTGDAWDMFPDVEQPPAKLPAAADAALSGASGVVRGAAETAMLPITIPRLIQEKVLDPTLGRAADFMLSSGEDLVRYIFGADPLTDEVKEQRFQQMTETRNPLYTGQDAVRRGMKSVLHEPQTTTGEYAGTIGEFAVPGAAMNKGASALRKTADVLVPAVVSETAGQAADGTAAEPYARVAGALAGTGGVAAAANRSNAPEAMIRSSVAKDTITPEQWEKARQIQNNQFGVTITGPEAIQQATGGNTRLGSLMRVVEGSQPGGTAMLPHLTQRPSQIDQATQDFLDRIAPVSSNPSALGPRAQTTAQGVIDDTRQGINDATRQSYAASAGTPIPFVDIAKNPRYGETVDWVRNNLQGYENVADNSVEMADAVAKRLFDEADAAKNVTSSSFSNQRAADATSLGEQVRSTARDASDDYATALNVQAERRTNILDPLEQGPVGRIAKTGDTREAYSAILPKAPLTGSEGEVAKTVMAIGQRDPELASSLVRQNLADAYDTSAKRLVGGENQYVGARYAKEIAGTPQQEINLNAAVSGLPDEMLAAILPDYLEVMRATGQRMPMGSPTAYNNMIQQEAAQGSLANQVLDTVRSAGTGLGTVVTDATKRKLYGKNMGALGEMFVAPNSVDLILEAIMRDSPAYKAATAGSMLRTAPQQGRDDK